MIVLGVDPGFGITGYGVVQSGTVQSAVRLLEAGVVRTSTKKKLEQRLEEIYSTLSAIIDEFHPELIAFENAFSLESFPRSGIAIGHVQGLVYLLSAQKKISVCSYFPIEVKKSLLGYGRASKLAVQQMVQRTFKLRTLPQPDDAADAIAVALCCLGRMRSVPSLLVRAN